MSWLSKNWKRVIIGACGVVGAVATFVPAVIPAAAICAVAAPAIAGSPDILSGLKNLVVALGPKPPAK